MLGIIAALSVVSAGTEVLALVSIAPLVQAAADGNTRYQGSVGPIELDLSISQMAWLSGAMLIAALIFQAFATYVSTRLTSGYYLRTRLEVVRAFQNSDWSVQAQEREGWLRTLSTDNVDAAQAGLQALVSWLKGALGTLIFLVGALLVNVGAVLVIVVVLGLVALGLRPLNTYLRRISADFAVLNVEVSEELAVLTMNARELRLYGVVRAASENHRRIALAQRDIVIRAGVAEGLGTPVFRTAAALLIVGMIAVAANNGSADIAAVGVVALLLYRSSNYATVLVGVHQRLARIVPTMDQLDVGLKKLWDNQIVPGIVEPTDVHVIEAQSVTFRYPQHDAAVLDHVSIRISNDEVVGIVGPSGGGKTTLAELLVGLRRPSDGGVLVDGTPMSELSDQARTQCIALVSQNVPVLPGTIRENIRFFRDVDDADVEMAVRAAGLGPVVDDLPNGLDTIVGPGSRALSGGQAQRLGIARALAGRPSIILLDEPTSALDAVAEHVITETIGSLRGKVGVVVIAHRLTTLRHCDRVLVVERGRITDEGTMEELRGRSAFMTHALEVGQLD